MKLLAFLFGKPKRSVVHLGLRVNEQPGAMKCAQLGPVVIRTVEVYESRSGKGMLTAGARFFDN